MLNSFATLDFAVRAALGARSLLLSFAASIKCSFTEIDMYP